MDGAAKPFNLETVLKFKKRRKDEASQRLVQAEKNRNAVAQILAEKQEEQLRLIDQLENLQKVGIEVQMLIFYEDRISFLKNEEKSIRKTLREKENIVTNERKRLIDCAREHQALSDLKERQNIEWKKYLEKKDAATLDEIAVLRHSRKE